MNPKLIPILERIIAREPILLSFHADNLPQSALAYVRERYVMSDTLTPEEQDLIETLAPFADNIADSFRDGTAPDASVYHLFDDGSLWLKTNAYSSVWTDATDYAIEVLLPRMSLSRMDAELLREIGMEDSVDFVRADFFGAFARVLNRDCGIPFHESRIHWDAWSRQAPDSLIEQLELGGLESGTAEGNRFAADFLATLKNA
jgi:hypothetical protein